MSCCYQKLEKCKECKFVTYKDCQRYRYWRAKWLLKEILPLTLRDVKPLSKGYCYFSRSEDDAKQGLAQTALRVQKRIRKLTINQVMTVVLDGDIEIEEELIYIECRKITGDSTKIQSVCESFIDKMTLKGKTISIFAVPSTISLNESWIKIMPK